MSPFFAATAQRQNTTGQASVAAYGGLLSRLGSVLAKPRHLNLDKYARGLRSKLLCPSAPRFLLSSATHYHHILRTAHYLAPRKASSYRLPHYA